MPACRTLLSQSTFPDKRTMEPTEQLPIWDLRGRPGPAEYGAVLQAELKMSAEVEWSILEHSLVLLIFMALRHMPSIHPELIWVKTLVHPLTSFHLFLLHIPSISSLSIPLYSFIFQSIPFKCIPFKCIDYLSQFSL